MSKMQELLTANKKYLWWWEYDIQLSLVNTDIWLRQDKEWDIWEFIEKKSLNDLIFWTDFIRRLKWNNLYWDTILYWDIVHHDETVKTKHKLTDTWYILCRLAMMDTDLERIKFIEENTHL